MSSPDPSPSSCALYPISPAAAGPLVVVDLKTSGAEPARHHIVEVAWWDLSTNERFAFVPHHDPSEVLATADPDALKVNGYIERELWRPENQLSDDATHRAWAQLRSTLVGPAGRPLALLCGHNPWFDAAFLTARFSNWLLLRDLGNYAAGILDVPLDEPLTLSRVCHLLDVEPGHHTAESDVTAAGWCFVKLAHLRMERVGRSSDHHLVRP